MSPTSGSGRKHEYRRGLAMPVPDDFTIPTCSDCGELFLSEEEYDRLFDLQKPAFIEWQKKHLGDVVKSIRDRHAVRLRDVERACGVTGTYLSHVLAGRKEASATLIGLLEAFARHPAEFRRQLDGGDWQQVIGLPR